VACPWVAARSDWSQVVPLALRFLNGKVIFFLVLFICQPNNLQVGAFATPPAVKGFVAQVSKHCLKQKMRYLSLFSLCQGGVHGAQSVLGVDFWHFGPAGLCGPGESDESQRVLSCHPVRYTELPTISKLTLFIFPETRRKTPSC
jgi:hypothetical protein